MYDVGSGSRNFNDLDASEVRMVSPESKSPVTLWQGAVSFSTGSARFLRSFMIDVKIPCC